MFCRTCKICISSVYFFLYVYTDDIENNVTAKRRRRNYDATSTYQVFVLEPCTNEHTPSFSPNVSFVAPVALLIDGENIPSTFIAHILAVAGTVGGVTIRYVYGNCLVPNMKGWQETILAMDFPFFISLRWAFAAFDTVRNLMR